jgi:hypothetical protein
MGPRSQTSAHLSCAIGCALRTHRVARGSPRLPPLAQQAATASPGPGSGRRARARWRAAVGERQRGAVVGSICLSQVHNAELVENTLYRGRVNQKLGDVGNSTEVLAVTESYGALRS